MRSFLDRRYTLFWFLGLNLLVLGLWVWGMCHWSSAQAGRGQMVDPQMVSGVADRVPLCRGKAVFRHNGKYYCWVVRNAQLRQLEDSEVPRDWTVIQ